MDSAHSAGPRPVVGVTLGDAAGIGPEVVRAALASGQLDGTFDYRIVGEEPSCVPGRPTPGTARASWDSLEEAASLVLGGALAAVVTGPVSKRSGAM